VSGVRSSVRIVDIHDRPPSQHAATVVWTRWTAHVSPKWVAIVDISTRTPEGVPNRCPVCDKEVRISPSDPAGDAPCPHCGCLLWFVVSDAGILFYERAVEKTPASELRSEAAKRKAPSEKAGRVRIKDGPFASFDGEIAATDEENRRVTVVVNLFGRSCPVELEDWQIEPVEY
jgi:hypothetical protein